MLIAFQLLELELVARTDFGKLALGIFLLVRALLVENGVTVKFYAVACGCETAITVNTLRDRVYFRLYRILNTGRHKTCNKTLPDERIELVLIRGQARPYHIGSEGGIGRSDRLVSVLSVAPRFKVTGLLREIFLTVGLQNKAVGRRPCLLGNSQGVGSHICYKTGRADSCDINALVKLLSGSHRALSLEAHSARSLLLEC